MKCSTEWCRNQAQPKRKKCCRCKNNAEREREPMRYHYHRMKANAKRRGIAFALSLDSYRAIWWDEGKWVSGAKPKGWVIDRINPKLGYTRANCWLLTKAEHARKTALEAMGLSVSNVLRTLMDESKTDIVPF